jgi:hypothetical protein
MGAYVETWKAIAGLLGRSERWCRYMARRAQDPLPIFKIGGIARLLVADVEAWLDRERRRSQPIGPARAAPTR